MSRYPTFGGGGYDESLLRVAPQITKADRQQGYNVDILEQGGTPNFYGPQFGPDAPRPSPQQFTPGYEQPRSQQRQTPAQPGSSNDQSLPSLEKVDYYSSAGPLNQRDIHATNTYTPPKKPWFRTKRGLAIIFFTVLLIAGAVVGIAVGITTTKTKAKADEEGVQEGARQGSGGAGAAPSGGQADTGLPSLPSTLSLVSLDLAQQPAATASAPVAVVPVINPTLAASAVVQSAPAATTPSRTSRTTVPTARPTQNVDSICERFPTLPACQRR
jgi:hypothetical protein